MQLTTIEQLTQVQVSGVLFLINPFSNGDQRGVNITIITISKVEKDHFETHTHWVNPNCEFFGDMLRPFKYVYTTLEEAESKLEEVRSGIHKYDVKKHHNSCESDRSDLYYDY
jgi:hypothetical protein